MREPGSIPNTIAMQLSIPRVYAKQVQHNCYFVLWSC